MPDIPTTPSGTESGEPEKYIRTFAGDMDTVQKGGVPDLTPLEKTEPAPLERIVAASPLPPKAPALEAPAVFSPPPPPQPAGPAPIKTYESDFSKRVKETNASTATVLAAEQDALPTVVASGPSQSKGGVVYIIAGIVLLLAGGIGAYFAYEHYLAASAPIVVAPSVSAPIFVDEREELLGTGSVMLQAIQKSVVRPIASGSVRFLYVASTSQGSVFSLLPFGAPDILVRNVHAQGSMAGVVTVTGVQSPFFILSVSSYSDTFAGMLSWETAMPHVLEALFPAYPAPVVLVGTSTLATTVSTSSPQATATTTKSKSPKPVTVATTSTSSGQASSPQATTTAPVGFKDEVVSNHDVRVYRDEQGRSVLIYGYWNQMTLIIARDTSAFSEIIQRLATSRSH